MKAEDLPQESVRRSSNLGADENRSNKSGYIAGEGMAGGGCVSRRKRSQTYLVFDEGGERKKIEQVGEEPPDVGVSVFA